ncbi:hypothetical protein H0O00_02865 [Candidatus Micrarchaeota archaeon]|nr:hypothetical protein [Candidatus Micrarchaeota archaeon]
MRSAEEIDRLKKELHGLEKRMEKIGTVQLPTVIRLSERLIELMSEIESTREKEKSLWNPAVITRIKIAKKEFGLFKGLNYFEREVAGEFEKGNVPEDAGRRFILIAKLIKDNKMQSAKKEFGYFEEIIELSRRYEKAAEEMKEEERILGREQFRIEKILAEMSELEKEAVDLEKAHRYEELLGDLERLKTAREAYLHSLLSMPVVELLGEIEKHPLKDHYRFFPGKEEMAGLKRFFSEYPVFGKCDAGQLCEFFGYSEKKLSHVCPETSRFRKVVLGNRRLFETLSTLHHTDFLAVDDGDGKVMDFYAERIGGAREIVERIMELRKEKRSDREEYEKRGQIEKRKAELSKYSKTELEAELKGIRHLLGLLHSEAPAKDAEGEGGLLSGFGLFLKKLTGPGPLV